MDETVSHDMLQSVAAAVSIGVMLVVIARRTNLPAIVLLLAGGVVLGPVGLNIIRPESLGSGLSVVVSLAVGLILFEGGLTLDLDGYRSASTMIRRLLTVGVLITWILTALAIRFVIGTDLRLAVIAASLVIVTGPTVIAPLLKRIRVEPKVNSILHWEGVLIDPIGVFVAVLCFEWIVGTGGGQTALLNFAGRIGGGIIIGIVGGFVALIVLKRRYIPEDLINGFTIAIAVLMFGLGEIVQKETGLLAVTVGGFVVGAGRPPQVKQMRAFKGEVADLLIGMVFLLLASRLELEQFKAFGWEGVAVIAIVMLIVRPVSIFSCSFGLDLSLRQRAFLSWIAPRGIVAASMASLFAIELKRQDVLERPEFVETFTYSVIICTITLQGLTAGFLAKLLHLRRPDPKGWMIVGAHAFGRRIAEFISRNADVPVILIDSNKKAVSLATDAGLPVIHGDARDLAIAERQEMQEIGHLIAITDNVDLNTLLNDRWAGALGRDRVYRWAPPTATSARVDARADDDVPGRRIWSRLPKPSLLSAEINKHEAMFLERRLQSSLDEAERRKMVGSTRILLLSCHDDKVQPDPDAEHAGRKSGRVHPDEIALLLDRRTNVLGRSIAPELVIRAAASSIDDLFPQLVDALVKHVPTLSRDEILEELIEREKSFPTSLGMGVAVPHAYAHGISERYCAIARIPDGMQFAPSDKEPVRLVFLLISPTGDPEGHLEALAEIARLASDERIRKQLIEDDDAERIVELVRRETSL